ncbi:MAG: leucine-rich repeat domain-containing protein, partial [Coriobacteriales bacterium]|nr:leucine-rich repeat domain-containing protein [Coriobacteriales bacterium]
MQQRIDARRSWFWALIPLILGFMFLLAFTPPTARAAVIASGDCGATSSDDLTWTLDDSGLLTISGTGAMADFDSQAPWRTYADQIRYLDVSDGCTHIGARSFTSCGLTSIYIPPNVQTIGLYAFSGCSQATSLEFASNSQLQGLAPYAFFYCTGLTEVTLPASLATLQSACFANCTALDEITFLGPAPNFIGPVFTSVTATVYYDAYLDGWTSDKLKDYDGNLTWVSSTVGGPTGDLTWSFNASTKTLNISGEGYMGDYLEYSDAPWYEYRNDIEHINIASGCLEIGDFAFYGTRITSIDIPTTVESIGWGSFYQCAQLTSVIIPPNVKT